MLSCRGKFKLFQGIQWINSIKVNSKLLSILADQGVLGPSLLSAHLTGRNDNCDNCRQELWPGWRFDIFLILSLVSCNFYLLMTEEKMRSGDRRGVPLSGDGGKIRRYSAGEKSLYGGSRVSAAVLGPWVLVLPSLGRNIKTLHRWDKTR